MKWIAHNWLIIAAGIFALAIIIGKYFDWQNKNDDK
jgi:hypothetical protein